MGKKAMAAQRVSPRTIRRAPLSAEEQQTLRATAVYEGSPFHKRNPGDFGLTPPAAPRPDKTLCDEARVTSRADATDLFLQAIERGIVSADNAVAHFPKYLWVVDAEGQPFEAIHGGSRVGAYHGYPIRRSNPFFEEVVAAWNRAHG